MNKSIFISLLVIFFSKSFCQNLYVSPGLQVGVNSEFKFFFSGQLTLGMFNPHASTLNPGITLGYKKMKRDDIWKSYHYYDLQLHNMGNIIQPGFGVGLIKQKNLPHIFRFKIWAGWFILGSYEYINFPEYGKNHFGIFGVLPLITDIGKKRKPLVL